MTMTLMMTIGSLLAFQSLLTTPIQATDILAFHETDSCGGEAGVSCVGHLADTCCSFDPTTFPTVQIIFSNPSCEQGTIFKGAGCENTIAAQGPRQNENAFCFTKYGAPISGVMYRCVTSASSTESLSGTAQAPRNETVKPNAVVYRPRGVTDGMWVLETKEVHDMLMQLQLQPVDHKLAWMKALGARFRADSLSE